MHSGKKIYGAVNINMPAPYPLVIAGFILLIGALLILGLCINFTSKYEVKGYLEMKSGTSPIYALRPGVIADTFVKSGQIIKKGQKLFLIDTLADQFSYAAEQRLLKKRLQRVESDIAIKQKYLQKLKPLLAKHYLSVTAYQAVRDQLNDLETNRHEQEMALLHHQQSRSYVLRAPISGMISSLVAHDGQTISASQSLLTVLPQESELVAQLYVPVSKSGFLKPGARIALRYDGYPFQHFGIARAHIQTISHSILTDKEEDKPINISEPYYKVLANLDQQYIFASGKTYFLQQGMTCTAVISGAQKKLWRWILDPVHHYARG